ncbi:aldo/keto reductase [Micromonospora sp. M12]
MGSRRRPPGLPAVRHGVLVWSPLAFGFLSGRYRRDQPIDLSSGRAVLRPAQFDPAIAENAAKLDIVEQLVDLAASIGCTLPQLAIAFTVAHPAVTSAIIGPRTLPQLEDLLKGATLTLDDATLDRIDEIVPPGRTGTTPTRHSRCVPDRHRPAEAPTNGTRCA